MLDHTTFGLLMQLFCIGLVLTLSYMVRRARRGFSIRRWLRTRLMDATIQHPPVLPNYFKSYIFSNPLDEIKPDPTHTHPTSAAYRNRADRWIGNVARALGRRPVYLQASLADMRNDNVYANEWFWVADLSVPQREERLLTNDVAVLVDSDYYTDMNHLLSVNSQTPFAIYSFTPETAGQQRGEYSYYFDDDGEIRYIVSGGARYTHPLWDYAADYLQTSAGFFHETCYWAVERRLVDPDHSVIWFMPAARVRWGFNWLITCLGWGIQAKPLVRFNPVLGEFARFMVSTPNGTMVSTARVRSFDSCTVPAQVDSCVRAAACATTITMSNHTVESYGVTKNQAIFLTDFWRHQKIDGRALMAIGPAPVIHYEAGPEIDVESKTCVVPYMGPIIAGSAFAPLVSEGNMATAIQKRILDLTDNSIMTSFIDKCMNEFIELVLIEAGVQRNSMDLSDMELVYARQKRLNQRHQLERAAVTQIRAEQDGTAFMKGEVYAEIKDPRVITNFKEDDKVSYAVYIYGVTRVLKTCSWYAFVEPMEIESRMLKKFDGKPVLIETDLSRWDGRYGIILRVLELRFMLAIFRLTLQDSIMRQHSKDHHKRVFAAFELCYQSAWHRLSGSAATSAFNTLGNAFGNYLSLRTKYAPGSRKRGCVRQMEYTPVQAYSMLGIFGGDDGLCAVPEGFDTQRIVYAYSLIGQVCKMQVRERAPVSFLGRIFGELYSGSANSCADIVRQLVKFHLTTDKLTDPLEKFIEKAYAFYVLDSNTPILGALGQKAKRLMDRAAILLKSDFVDGSLSYNAALWLQEDTVFMNVSAPWMWDLLETPLDGFDLDRFVSWCQADSVELPVPFLIRDVPLPLTDHYAHVPMITVGDVSKLRERKPKVQNKPSPDQPKVDSEPTPQQTNKPARSEPEASKPPRPRSRGSKGKEEVSEAAKPRRPRSKGSKGKEVVSQAAPRAEEKVTGEGG